MESQKYTLPMSFLSQTVIAALDEEHLSAHDASSHRTVEGLCEETARVSSTQQDESYASQKSDEVSLEQTVEVSSAQEKAQQCPICLGPITGEAFLDPCFHQFCYHCILQWAEMVATHPSLEGDTSLECPLCKTRSACIIHHIVLNTFQRHYLYGTPPCTKQPFLLSQSHYQRLHVYMNNQHRDMAKALNQKIKRRRKELHISGNDYLQPWVHRELQALLQEEDVSLITQHVLGVLEHFEKRQKVELRVLSSWKEAMADAVKPFLYENAETFCNELQNFLFSGLSVQAYDQLAEETRTARTLQVLKG